jgi:hypothetical protein
VVGRDAEVCSAFFHHLQHRVQHADHGAGGPISALGEAAQAIEVPKQLVGAVDQMNEHGGGTTRCDSTGHITYDCGCLAR